MTPQQFRAIALSMPEAFESAHMGHPDFRIRNKIFATLTTRGRIPWGMVKLTPAQQSVVVKENPDVFQPVPGGWGSRGATQVELKNTTKEVLKNAMFTAWSNLAPKKLVKGRD